MTRANSEIPHWHHWANGTISAVAAILFLGSILPQWYLWGADYLKALPMAVRIILLAAIVVCSIPAVSSRLGQALTRIGESLDRKKTAVIFIIASSGLLPLFVYLSSDNHALGDGYVLLGTLAEGGHFSATEPLDYFWHHLLFILMGSPNAAYWAYALTSYLAGIMFLLILFIFLKDKTDFLLALALVFAFGAMQYFFGYVESYTTSFVFSFLYILFGWRDYTAGRLSKLTIAALFLAVACHLNALILMPSFLLLLWKKYPSRAMKISSMAIVVAGIVGGAFYLDSFTKLNLHEIFVPPWSHHDNPYTLLSGAHLLDLINIVLLDIPLIVLLPLLVVSSKKEMRPYFLWVIVPSLIFTLAVDPRIGAIRDWDLLALPSAPLMAFFIITLTDHEHLPGYARYALLIPLALFSILHTGSWVLHNTDKDAGYLRIREIIRRDVHYSERYLDGYRNKSWAMIAERSYDDIGEAIRASRVRFNVDKTDVANSVQLADYYFMAGDTVGATDIILLYKPEDIEGDKLAPAAGPILMAAGYLNAAEKMFQQYFRNGFSDWSVYHNMGYCLQQRGQIDSAFIYFAKSYENRPDASIGSELEFYMACIQNRKIELAMAGLERIAPNIPIMYRPYVTSIIEAIQDGNLTRADSLAVKFSNQLTQNK